MQQVILEMKTDVLITDYIKDDISQMMRIRYYRLGLLIEFCLIVFLNNFIGIIE